MPDDTVDLAVRWAESGQDVPARTVTGLRAIEAAAGGASAGVGDRLANAFARFEAREPTMVVRRTMFAFESLAASAIGASGPVGRLAATFALLGGPEGAILIAGIAAIGLAWKAMSNEAQLAADNVDAAAKRMREAIGAATKEGFGPERQQLFQQRIAEAKAELALVEASAVPAAVTRSVYTPYGYSTSTDTSAADARQAKIDNLKTLIGQLTAGLADLGREGGKAADQGLRKVREEIAGIGSEIAALVTGRISGVPLDETLRGIGVPSMKDILGIPGGFTAAGVGERKRADMDILGPIIGKPSALAGKEALEKSLRGDSRDEKEMERLGAAISRGIATVSRGGDPLGAAGGVLSQASTLKMFASAAPVLGPLGMGLSVLGSLFGGSDKPKITISAYEQQALDQMKSVVGLPVTTQVIVVGGSDMRSVQQALNNLQRLGVITRLPR